MEQAETYESRVATVRRTLSAYATGDSQAFAESMTEDAVIRPSAFITGRKEYLGRAEARDCVEHGASILSEHGERLRLHPLSTYIDEADPSQVLSLCRLSISRGDGTTFGSDAAYLWTFEGGLIARLDTWLDHAEGITQLERPARLGRPELVTS